MASEGCKAWKDSSMTLKENVSDREYFGRTLLRCTVLEKPQKHARWFCSVCTHLIMM